MVVEVAAAVQYIASAGVAVGATGSAVLGVKVLIQSFKSLRGAGLSHRDAFREARAANQPDGEHAAGRQLGKDYESIAMGQDTPKKGRR